MKTCPEILKVGISAEINFKKGNFADNSTIKLKDHFVELNFKIISIFILCEAENVKKFLQNVAVSELFISTESPCHVRFVFSRKKKPIILSKTPKYI